MKKRLYSAVVVIFLAAPVFLLAGCGSSSDSDTDIGFTDPGFWGTDGATPTFQTVYDTTSGSVTYGTTYSEAGSGDTAKSFITSYTINSVNYIAIMYCADYTSPTSFAIKLYFTVDTLPSTLGSLGTINLLDGTHNPVIKVRPATTKTFIGGTPTGTLSLTFSAGASKAPSKGSTTTTINTVSVSSSVNAAVPGGGTLTGFTFTDLVPVPY